MLVLSRKKEQTLVFRFNGVEVVLKVLSDPGDKRVRFGIEAPTEVIVLRGELTDAERKQ